MGRPPFSCDGRSIERLSHYGALHTEKINTDGKSPMEITDEVINIQEKTSIY
ncbi:MAG TPA: hypothetical protein IAB53_12410 [Candidatus Scybalocola faecipullorum]|nr:hypothetical protein [Candidatus Scybalocola faecipullorum]